MEQQFLEDEFEQFLRQNADQHRMYPSEGVWTNIYRHFHSGRRRIALGAMLILVLSGIIWMATTNPNANTNAIKTPAFQDNNAGLKNSGNSSSINSTSTSSSVTVDDIIEKLRAKSLMPPLTIEAPLSLAPLHLNKVYVSDAYKVLHTQPGVLSTKSPISRNAAFLAETELMADLISSNVLRSIGSGADINIPAPGKMEAGRLLVTKEIAGLKIPTSINTIHIQAKSKNRFSLLMHFAPSIGYRNLYKGKSSYTYGSSPLMVRHLNVNQFVDHQPAIGFEFGGGIRYQASRALAFRTGLQLNLTRYTIEAFSHFPEKATLSLNNAYGYRSDTLLTTSNVRNLSGNNPERLQNQYIQIAIPIGAELKLFGDSKLQVNFAGSIQPSYLLNTNQYLLSSDFSNYVKEPSLIRRWNVASHLEAFVSYQNGDIRWQVGPQFRYNLLSTYKKEYPIKENLIEYGLKIGVSKTIR
jgi:hypothetical protein